MEKRNKRILMSVLGVVVCGISVGFFKRASFGVDPFQSMMSGLDAIVPIPFGTLYVIVNAILLLFALLCDRKRIGLATVINLFLLGYIVDFSHRFLLWCIPEAALPLRLLLLAIGIVAMCLSSSFYFTANLGVSTYDAISLIMAENWKIAPFRFCRIGTDLVCVGTGILLFFLSGQPLSALAGMVGIGTIITAFFMGPLIEFFNVHVARPFLAK
jgi:uncharacterized membrane protein YczE